MFEIGDVVRSHSPTASKEKYHLCLGDDGNGPRFVFLHLNSKSGFRGDCVLDDGRISGLPKSPTGETIVSFSVLVKIGGERLKLFGAAKTGEIDANLAGELIAFVKDTPVLTYQEREFVRARLDTLLELRG